MDGVEQARAYAEADFAATDQALVDRLGDLFGEALGPLIVDLGCGPGNITFRLAERYPASAVLGIDGAAAMLAIAEHRRQAWTADSGGEAAGGLSPCFRQVVLPSEALEMELAGQATAVVSNSLLHHLHDPQALWRTLRRLAAPGAVVLVKDLRRPSSQQVLEALVERQMAAAPEVLRHDYRCSLQAAFTPAEVEDQLVAAGLTGLRVKPLEDRYLEIVGRLLG